MEENNKPDLWTNFSWERFFKIFLSCFFIMMSTQMLRDYKNWQHHFDTANLLAKIAISACFSVGIQLIKRNN
jgi:hypothetical protein